MFQRIEEKQIKINNINSDGILTEFTESRKSKSTCGLILKKRVIIKCMLMSINLLKVKYVNDLTSLFTKMHQLVKVRRSMKYTYARECTLTLM